AGSAEPLVQLVQPRGAERRMERRVQGFELWRGQRHRQRYGVFPRVLRRAGFGDRDDGAAADHPREGDRGGRAATRRADLLQGALADDEVAFAAERRVGHDRYAVFVAPGQQFPLDATVVETVGNLIGCAAPAIRHTQQRLHLLDVEIGHSPRANLASRTQLLKRGHDAGELRAGSRRVQQIEIQVVGAKALEAGGARTRDAIPGHLVGLNLGDQEDPFALTGQHVTDELLRAAAAVVSRGIQQSHAERHAGAQRSFLQRGRMLSIPQMPAALSSAGSVLPSGSFTVRATAFAGGAVPRPWLLACGASIAPRTGSDRPRAAQRAANRRRLSNCSVIGCAISWRQNRAFRQTGQVLRNARSLRNAGSLWYVEKNAG